MLNKNKHRQIMLNILIDIYKSDLSKYLAFKWGTATYFLYKLDRFSTDLDFDLLINKDIDNQIIEIIKKYGNVKKKNKIILSYQSWEDNLKIDINRKVRKNNHYKKVNLFWVDINIQDSVTIFTNKLVALIERNTNRDIYDVRFFFKNNFEINEKLILERLWITKIELFQLILKKIKSLWDSYKILDWLWEVLDKKQKVFVKNSLISELIWILEMNISLS